MDRGMSPLRGRIQSVFAAVIVFCLLAPAVEARGPYRKGDHVLISGRVTDAGGQPIANVTVLLELSRTSFSWLRLKQVKKNTLRIPVKATVDGQYLHDWRWDGYYNTFELAVAVPQQQAGGQDFEILERLDITGNVLQGGPVVMPLVVKDAGATDLLQRMVGDGASAEERRVFEEMGRPERIDTNDDGTSAWWYFEAGKVYRFRAGALEQVEHFEPIKSP